MESKVIEIIRDRKDIIGFVRHFALPPRSIKSFKISDTLILVKFRSDERYILRYFGEACFRPIDAWIIQNFCDRISSYTEEEFREKTGLGKTLEIYEYNDSCRGI